MSNKEILEKAIQKAIDGGWHNNTGYRPLHIAEGYDEETGLSYTYYDEVINVTALIFNHSFAKALWGESNEFIGVKGEDGLVSAFAPIPRWKNKLQQMVIADDPIKYLGSCISVVGDKVEVELVDAREFTKPKRENI